MSLRCQPPCVYIQSRANHFQKESLVLRFQAFKALVANRGYRFSHRKIIYVHAQNCLVNSDSLSVSTIGLND